MPDLDTELTSLRDRLHQSIPQPDLARVAARSRQRTTRRRMQLGAAVAVLVVTAAVPVLRAQSPDRPSTPPPRPTEQRQVQTPSVEFADADHGYAISGSCRRGAPDLDCRFALLMTADGGEHWVRRTLPAGMPEDGKMTVLGPNRLALDSGQDQRMLSDDGGRTWRRVAVPIADGTVPAIPDGAQLRIVPCAPHPGDRWCAQVAATLPESGQTVRLASQPPLASPNVANDGRIPTASGAWWVVGRDPTTQEWSVAMSWDDGRSWTASALLPAATSPNFYLGWSITERDGMLYATVSGDTGGKSGLLAVFTSTDNGRTWTRTWHPGNSEAPMSADGTVAAADGRLLIYSFLDEQSFVSTDDGRTFAVESKRGLAGAVRWTRAGYLMYPAAEQDGNVFRLSTDGVHWRKFTIG